MAAVVVADVHALRHVRPVHVPVRHADAPDLVDHRAADQSLAAAIVNRCRNHAAATANLYRSPDQSQSK